MGFTVKFRIFGPLEVWAGGTRLRLRGPRQERALAAMLLDADRAVTIDQLVEAVWDDPPPTAHRQIRDLIPALRRLLATSGGQQEIISTHRLGYMLGLDAAELDARVFEQLVAAARARAASEPAAAVEQMRAALSMGRGPTLAGITSRVLEPAIARWEERRLAVYEEVLALELRLGRHAAVIGELSALVAERALRERPVQLLMLALYRTGRSSEALEVYDRLRRRLAGDVGIDPGAELRELHRAILRGSVDEAPPVPTSTPPAPRTVPAQLPMDVRGFTGRGPELARLDALLFDAPAPATAVVIAAMSGTAGVGKTALAVHWGHLVRDRFPDGQLYVNLRGYDRDLPLKADDALALFLSALGVPGPDIPLELDARAAQFRTEVAGRRMLIVLDNASAVEQVRPLLPGSPSCAVVVTSRDSLSGLVAVHGAERLDLDLLSQREAVALLRRLIGSRVEVEPDAAAVLAVQCARLPLALRVAAEHVVAHPDVSLADLVAELADRRRRLDLLDAGEDPRASVTAVFSWSVRKLPPPAARMFRLLGLHPAADFDIHAAAALAEVGVDEAGHTMDKLVRAHLVHVVGGRYGMHDLLRAYAVGLVEDADAGGDGRDAREALGRLFDYYVAAAAAAMDVLHPVETARRVRPSLPTIPLPDLSEPDAARDWLDVERQGLTAVAAHTAGHGWLAHTVQLAATLYEYLIGGHCVEALAIHGRARDAAREAGDPAGEADALLGLGIAHSQLGRHAAATTFFEQAIPLFEAAGEAVGRARAVGNVGVINLRLGSYDRAIDYFGQALTLHRQAGNRNGQAAILNNLGMLEEMLGRYASAADYLDRARALFRELGNRVGEAEALNNLGMVKRELGEYAAAMAHHEAALPLFKEVGNRLGEAWTHDNLGRLYLRRGRPEPAAAQHRQALALFRGMGHPDCEAWALNGLGEAARAVGDTAEAAACHSAALTLARETGGRDQEARAHAGLGMVRQLLGEVAAARHHYERALDLFTELKLPSADEVRARLVECARSAAP
jgi:DNA-binding SARP family transcriptional activator/Tfp pilus assembly protein PilF